MTDFTSKNKAALEGTLHVVKLEGAADCDGFEKIETRVKDSPTAAVHHESRSVLLHSKYDPIKEAERWAESSKAGKNKAVFVFGLGLGYHIEALLRIRADVEKIYVVEVNPGVIKAAFSVRDLEGLLSDERVKILAGQYPQIHDDVGAAIQEAVEVAGGNPEILIHIPSYELMPKDSGELQGMVEYIRLATSGKEVFKKEKEENTAANLESFASARGVKELFGAYAGKPMIVAASGPSLTASLAVIAASGVHLDITVVDSALAPFRRAGVRPKFVVSGDPQNRAGALFKGIEIEDEQLIFFPSSSPEVVRLFAPEARWAACSDVVKEEVKFDEEYDKGLLYFSGTVLLGAVDFAVKSGASPIVLIGCDFAFTEGATHAEGSLVQGYNRRYGALREVEGLDGKPVKTSDVFYLYMRDLEHYYMARREKITLFNATESGAAVYHVPRIKLARFLEEYSRINNEG
ncbi:MAG TPA: DUF115 domain-containing protein [bacterium]|nr:DUF115 domain-containing protein [bacterium]